MFKSKTIAKIGVMALSLKAMLMLFCGCDSVKSAYDFLKDGDDSKPAAQAQTTLVADYNGMSENYVLLQQPLTSVEVDDAWIGTGNILRFDLQNRQADVLIPQTQNKSYTSVLAAIGDRVVMVEYKAVKRTTGETVSYVITADDVIMCDLETLVKEFDTDTPNKAEYFLALIDSNQKILYQERDKETNNKRLLAYDIAAGTIDDLFPDKVDAYIISGVDDRMKLVCTEDSSGDKVLYTFDSDIGECTPFFYLRGIENFSNLVPAASTTELIVYETTDSKIVFHRLYDTIATFTMSESTDHRMYIVTEMSDGIKQAIITEANITQGTFKHYHFDIDTETSQEIVLPAVSEGLEQNIHSIVIGSGKTLIQREVEGTKTNEIGEAVEVERIDVLLYDPSTNTVENLEGLVGGFFPETAQVDDIDVEASYQGKAMIEVEGEKETTEYERVLFFDGTNLTNLFGEYQNVNVLSSSSDDRYVAVEGKKSDGTTELVVYDMKYNTKRVADSFDSDTRLRNLRFSDDNTMMAYTIRYSGTVDTSTGETETEKYDSLHVQDLTTNGVQRDVSQLVGDGYIGIREFGINGRRLIIDKTTLEGFVRKIVDIYSVDIQSRMETHLCRDD